MRLATRVHQSTAYPLGDRTVQLRLNQVNNTIVPVLACPIQRRVAVLRVPHREHAAVCTVTATPDANQHVRADAQRHRTHLIYNHRIGASCQQRLYPLCEPSVRCVVQRRPAVLNMYHTHAR